MLSKLKELDKPITSAKENALLGRLWRSTMKELKLTHKVLWLINKYIKNADRKNIKVLKKKTRSSLMNAVISEELTWKAYVDLNYNLLNVKEMTITVSLKHANGRVSHHTILTKKDDVDLGDVDDIGEKDE